MYDITKELNCSYSSANVVNDQTERMRGGLIRRGGVLSVGQKTSREETKQET
jgi:hypothetical protein